MTTTLDAPADPVLIHCRRCGRPLTSPISRLLKIGTHCRTGLDERQLLTALTSGATA